MAAIILPYKPRELQREYHDDKHRWRFVLAHRRFGKTVMAVNELIKSALTIQKEDPRVYYLSPYLVQTKQLAWDYAKKFTAPIPGIKFNESELRIDFPNGARLQLLGGDNPDRLRGIYIDDIVLDEYDQINPTLFYEVIRPALSDRHGKATFMGTPKGKGNLFQLHDTIRNSEDWGKFIYRASETGHIDHEELEDAKKSMTEDLFLQEYECSFDAAIKGAFYAEEIKKADEEHRICHVPYDPNILVDTFWDIGWRDDTAILFVQRFGKEIRVIDAYSNSGMTLPEYKTILDTKGYRYGKHYLPWDAFVKRMSDGKSTAEVAMSYGMAVERSPDVTVMDGIQQGRMVLAQCWFDKDKTKDLLSSLSMYRREFDETRKVFRNNPLHDWTSHYADAFRYMAISSKESKTNDYKQAISAYMRPDIGNTSLDSIFR